MSHRLSLQARDDLAIEMRRHVLERRDPARLASLEDPDVQPNEVAQGVYAFEFFVQRYRGVLKRRMEEAVAYGIGWSLTSLLRDEQTRSVDRLTRMCVDLYLRTKEERGEIDELVLAWKEVEGGEFPPFEDEEIKLFLFEVVYEVAREAARERVEMLLGC